MKIQVSGLRLAAIVPLLILYSQALAQSPRDFEVSEVHWGPSAVVSVSAHSSPVDRGQAANYPPTSEVSVRFRNTATKAIKSVTWKCIFWEDEKRTKVLASYTFHSRKRIEPGSSVLLKKSVSALSEPRRWTNYQAVIVGRIDYTNGTVWQADK